MKEKKLMSIEEFRLLSTDEMCLRINKQLELENYSIAQTMRDGGYSFSWTTMRNEALKRGIKQGYYMNEDTDNDVVSSPKIEIVLKGKEEGVRRGITIEKEDAERIDRLTEGLTRTADKSSIVAAMLQYGIAVFEEAVKNGTLSLVRPAPQLFAPEEKHEQ